jgi:hypothetical protein
MGLVSGQHLCFVFLRSLGQVSLIRYEDLCGSPLSLQANTGAPIDSFPIHYSSIITQIDAM